MSNHNISALNYEANILHMADFFLSIFTLVLTLVSISIVKQILELRKTTMHLHWLKHSLSHNVPVSGSEVQLSALLAVPIQPVSY